MRYTFTGGSSGSIDLRLVRTVANKLVSTNTTIAYGCSASAFQDALNLFDSFSKYQTTVTRIIYDASNNVISTTAGAARIEYLASLNLLRPAAFSSEDFTYTYLGYTGTVTKAIVQEHSPLITGTWSLSIGSVTFDNLAFDAPAWLVQSRINTIVGYERVTVSQTSRNGAGYDNTWVISYIGVNGAVPTPTASGILSGGSTTPTIALTVRRAYSTAITFSPIDYRFLSTYSDKPNVLVSTNGIPAICMGNCGYTFIDNVKITALSRSGSTLSMTLTTNLAIDISSIKITVQKKPCTINGGSTLTALTCTLATNQDGSPLLTAGTFIPQVYIDPIGIAGLNTGVNPFSIPLVVTQLANAIGGNNGGYYNSISGAGFPTDKS